MKHLFFIAAALITAGTLSAQTDSSALFIGQETGALENQRFIDRYDYVFGTHEPARWLFKWDATGLLPALGINVNKGSYTNQEASFRIGAELKISPAFSLDASYHLGVGDDFSDIFSGDAPAFSHGFRLEPRWYFGMPRRIRRGLSANNFSGNYLGLELTHVSSASQPISGNPRQRYKSASLRFGIQRRLFRFGYFDMSYGLGIRDYPQTPYHRGATQFYADARLAAGIAFSTPKAGARASAGYCDVLQCFREENRMFKIDLFNLLRVASIDQIKGVARIAWEQKIAGSPFSIEGQVQIGGGYLNYEYSNQTILNAHSLDFGGHLQGRYYYGLKRRIATGKSGNNLSGAYLGWQADWFQDRGKVTSQGDITPIEEGTYSRTVAGTGPIWGIQYRLFKRGFIDFNLGAGWGNVKSTSTNNGQTTTGHQPGQLHLMGGLRIGLAF